MRTHTLIGERMLSVAPALAPVARLVRASHERWDGSGYPDGLRGAEIPVGARIIAICDAYEAMIERRPYRDSICARRGARPSYARTGVRSSIPELVEMFVEVLESDPRFALAQAPVAAVTKLLQAGSGVDPVWI